MKLELEGKVAIVTGGSRGIGKAIARQLADEGADVVIVARDRESNQATARELATDGGGRVLALEADTGDDRSVSAMVEAVIQAFGRIDILVNAAAQPGGQSKPPTLQEITSDHFWGDMNVKVMGYLRMAQAVAPHMQRTGFGRIINISGLAARLTGSTIGSIRNLSIVALTKNLADELAGSGINVTCVHPGLTRTEKTPAVLARQAQELGVSEAEVERRMASPFLLGRMISAEEIAYVVTFLASPKSAAINGDVIAAGGGIRGVIHC